MWSSFLPDRTPRSISSTTTIMSLSWIRRTWTVSWQGVHDEHTVVGPAGPRRAPVRIVGRHEGLHVRQGKPGRPVLWRVAAWSLDDPGHPRARVHGRAHRPRGVPLDAVADYSGCRGLGGREPRVRRRARQVPRGHAHDLERCAGSPHGVRRIWPDFSEPDPLSRSYLKNSRMAAASVFGKFITRR